MDLKGYIIFFLLVCVGGTVFAQKEQIPKTDVPLNKLDKDGQRSGPWWITNPAGLGESAYSEFGNYTAGIKYGKWYKIDHEGDITAVETYRYGRLDGEAKYYTKGILYASGSYRTFYTGGGARDSIWVMDPNTDIEHRREVLSDTNTVRHGVWRFYDEETGKLLREEEYELDSLILKSNYISPADSAALKKKEAALPHNKGRRKAVSNPKGQVLH